VRSRRAQSRSTHVADGLRARSSSLATMAPLFSASPLVTDPATEIHEEVDEVQARKVFLELAHRTLQLISEVLDIKAGKKSENKKAKPFLSTGRLLSWTQRSALTIIFMGACIACGWLWLQNMRRCDPASES
jgi:hypothetical protein